MSKLTYVSDCNYVRIIGTVDQCSRLKYTPTVVPQPVLRFTVETNCDGERLHHFMAAYGDLALRHADTLAVGQRILITGKHKIRFSDVRDGIKTFIPEIICDTVELL